MFSKSMRLAVLLVLCCVVRSSAQNEDLSRYVTPVDTPVVVLDATAAFEGLTEKEKLYAHWLSAASWTGAQITFRQSSTESAAILDLVMRYHSKNPIKVRRAASRQGIRDEELGWWDLYSATFLSNCGNYLSFGDVKFIPKIKKGRLGRLIRAVASIDGREDRRLTRLFEQVRDKMYSLRREERRLGLGAKGTSAYYGPGVTKKEIDLVSKYMVANGISAYNTRVFWRDDGTLSIRTAASESRRGKAAKVGDQRVAIDYGDYAGILRTVVQQIGRAIPYVANDDQKKMLQAYMSHFITGHIDDHKQSQIHWVKDQGPAVETNIGFIESYRDPVGVRGEWEGLVAVVNKEQSKKFGKLVDSGPALVAKLPWPKEFEKDSFRRPDFTSLEVLAFANSGIPAGINIPNYDDIRQNIGFKNVSLGNVLSARRKSNAKVTLIRESDQELYKELSGEAFEVQVGLHELLGHGSGKLFEKRADGTANFDPKTIDPTTGEPVSSSYSAGQTWGGVFGNIASSYEECRAEAVGLYLSLDNEALGVFGHEGEGASDITYTNWLIMARAGLAALTFYDPDSNKWGQAHMQARFALMRVMLEAGGDLLKIERSATGDWEVHLDRTKIATVGKKAIGEFLTRLMVYKTIGDEKRGREFYERMTSVESRFLSIRNYVFEKRKPRHIWVQPVTDIDFRGRVVMRTYPGTYRGVIDSFLDRYSYLGNRPAR